MENEPKIAVIILNWNGFDDTVQCLESLQGIAYNNYQVVLVDNASKNDEGKRLKFRFPYIHLIQNEMNRGFAGGNNDGINWALDNGFDYIVNLNNDCVVTARWLSNLVDGLTASKADFGSSMILFYENRNLVCSDGDVLFLDGTALPLNLNRTYAESLGTKPIFSACGAGSIYSKESLQSVKIDKGQYFDELFFAYFEDVDLGLRLNAKLFKGVTVLDAIIYHKHLRSSGKYSKFHVFQLEKNRLLIEFLNYPVYVIFLGEVFYICRKFLFCLLILFKKIIKSNFKIPDGPKLIDKLLMPVKARLWIIANIKSVLIDRRERKLSGIISSRLWRYFYWNFFKILN